MKIPPLMLRRILVDGARRRARRRQGPHRRRHARDAARRRARVSPDGKLRRVHGARDRLRREPRPLRHLARRRSTARSVAPADHAPRQRHRARVVARRQVRLLPVDARAAASQVWRIAPAGGEAEQVTKLPLDVNGFKLFPDGKRLVARDRRVARREDARRLGQARRRARRSRRSRRASTTSCCSATGTVGGRQVLAPVRVDAADWRKADDARDLTPGQTTDSPTHPFGGMEEVAISPDGKTVAFVVAQRRHATRVDHQHRRVPRRRRRQSKPVNAHRRQQGATTSRRRSRPTASRIALAHDDARRLRGRSRAHRDLSTSRRRSRASLTEAWDRSAGEITWAPDGKTIYTIADNVGNHVAVRDRRRDRHGEARSSTRARTPAPRVAGDRLVFVRDTLSMPAELFTVEARRQRPARRSRTSTTRASRRSPGATYEQFSFKGAKGDTVYGFVMKPAGFTRRQGARSRSLIHGGPQGSFGDHFHYRWNPQAYAGRGYGVVFIDFHGSTGYGQAFTDAIRGDWGGAPYEDLMLGLDAALAKYPWLDGNRAGRARRVVRRLHDQLDQRPDRSLQGARLPRRQPRRAHGLLRHRGAVVPRVGARRHAVGEARGLHEAQPDRPREELEDADARHPRRPRLPRRRHAGHVDVHRAPAQGHPVSRFLHFPDENHWVLKPQNSKLWHDEVLAWLDKYTKR